MKRHRTRIVVGIAVIALIGVVALRIVTRRHSGSTRRQNAPNVRVGLPTRDTVDNTLQSSGDVVSSQQANIVAKVSGSLEQVLVNIGEPVARDRLLALIDTTVPAQQLRQAEASLSTARADYERKQQLLADSLVARSDFETAQQLMKSAEANFQNAQTQLGYCRVTAPFSGTITKRFLDPGAIVSPGASTLFTLMDLDNLKVVINAMEKDVPLIKDGGKAVVTAGALPDDTFEGWVGRMSEAVDPATRTMPVEVFVPNRAHRLKPGMYATVVLVLSERTDAITVPTQAVLTDAGGAFVYRVMNDTARRVAVETGMQEGNRTEITAGLAGGESLITTGQQYVKAGGRVTIAQ